MKARRGYVYYNNERKAWYARLAYRDSNGKLKSIKRKAENKTHGEQVVLPELINTFALGGRPAVDAAKMTFNDLASYYLEHYVQEAQYAQGRKVAGLRSAVTVKGFTRNGR